MKYLFLSFFIFFSDFIFASTKFLLIIDSQERRPVSYCHLLSSIQNQIYISDINGIIEIDCSIKNLTVSHVAYVKVEHTIDCSKKGIDTIYLSPYTNELHEVEIKSDDIFALYDSVKTKFYSNIYDNQVELEYTIHRESDIPEFISRTIDIKINVVKDSFFDHNPKYFDLKVSNKINKFSFSDVSISALDLAQQTFLVGDLKWIHSADEEIVKIINSDINRGSIKYLDDTTHFGNKVVMFKVIDSVKNEIIIEKILFIDKESNFFSGIYSREFKVNNPNDVQEIRKYSLEFKRVNDKWYPIFYSLKRYNDSISVQINKISHSQTSVHRKMKYISDITPELMVSLSVKPDRVEYDFYSSKILEYRNKFLINKHLSSIQDSSLKKIIEASWLAMLNYTVPSIKYSLVSNGIRSKTIFLKNHRSPIEISYLAEIYGQKIAFDGLNKYLIDTIKNIVHIYPTQFFGLKRVLSNSEDIFFEPLINPNRFFIDLIYLLSKNGTNFKIGLNYDSIYGESYQLELHSKTIDSKILAIKIQFDVKKFSIIAYDLKVGNYIKEKYIYDVVESDVGWFDSSYYNLLHKYNSNEFVYHIDKLVKMTKSDADIETDLEPTDLFINGYVHDRFGNDIVEVKGKSLILFFWNSKVFKIEDILLKIQSLNLVMNQKKFAVIGVNYVDYSDALVKSICDKLNIKFVNTDYEIDNQLGYPVTKFPFLMLLNSNHQIIATLDDFSDKHLKRLIKRIK